MNFYSGRHLGPMSGCAALVALSVIAAMPLAALNVPQGGKILGTLDGISVTGAIVEIRGWACEVRQSASITVVVAADRAAGAAPLLTARADVPNEPAVDKVCGDSGGGRHRFRILVPAATLAAYEGHAVFVSGLPRAGVAAATPLAGSGRFTFPKPPVSYPPLAGAYRSSATRPRVFMTEADLRDFVARIDTPGTLSSQVFARLAAAVKADLARPIDWDAVYSGCDLDIYLRAFSIEERRGYTGEVRTEEVLRAALKVRAGASAPAGAAIVASRSALYVALLKAGAAAPAGAPSTEAAAAFAKRILLAWARYGMRDTKGHIFTAVAQFCDDKGHSDPSVQSAVGLQIGRGIIYSVHAEDLLQAAGAVSSAEARELDAFHAALFDLLLAATNYRFALLNHPASQCEAYSNHVPAALKALLAIARLLDDHRKFGAVLTGADPSIPVALPWLAYFDHAIYGEADQPIACGPNSGPDSLTSHPSFQTPIVAPGEVEDRYRNANPAQAIGYTAGNLAGIFDAAELLRAAGYDLYAYRGRHRQSLEAAAQYYACLADHAGFYKTVTSENSSSCRDHRQYVGAIVNQVEPSILIGAYRFPENAALTSLDAAAKAAWLPTANVVETIRFGRWRDKD